MGLIGCPETSVTNYQSTLRNIPEGRRSHLHSSRSLKSRNVRLVLTVCYMYKKVKVKVTLVQALRLCTGHTAHRGSRGIALLFYDQRHYKGVRGQRQAPAALYPRGKTRYPLYRKLGGPQGRSGHVRKISPPSGLDPRAVKTVTSSYTDWATRPTITLNGRSIIMTFLFDWMSLLFMGFVFLLFFGYSLQR